MNKDLKKYDVRLQEYRIRNGELSKEELEKHLKEIPDSADNVLPVSLDRETEEEEIH